MAYTLLKTNGLTLTVVQDGTLDTTTDLTFVGKNYTGYGSPVNENFVKLLENFSSTSPPSKPIVGQTWFDSANLRLTVYDGSKFKSLGVIDYGSQLPLGMNPGDLHFDSITNVLYAFNGVEWVSIGPAPSTYGQGGVNGFGFTLINDVSVNQHQVIESTIGTSTEFLISADPVFSVQLTDPAYSNFNTIYPGINIANTNLKGISAYYISGSTISGSLLWGTAATALGLVDYSNSTTNLVSLSDLIRKSELSTGTSIPIVTLNDNGITIGQQRVLKLYITNSNISNIEAINGQTIRLNVNVLGSSTNVVSIDGSNGLAILPNNSSPVSLGSASTSFSNLYVSTVTSSLVNASSVSSTVITGLTINANTVSSTGIYGSQVYDSGARVLTTATIGSYISGISSLSGTTNQISVSSSTGAVTLSLTNVVSVNSLSATVISGGAVYDNGRRVLTSATFTGGVLSVQGTSTQILVNGSSLASSGTVVLSFPSTIYVGSIVATNTISGSDIIATSDERLKSNISTIENALEIVTQLRGTRFNKKDSNKRHIGVIAQEVQSIVPEVVYETPDGYLGVSYGNIVGLLIEAIKEQQQQINELNSKLGN